MLKWLQTIPQLYLKLFEPLTFIRKCNSEPSKALLTQGPVVQEAVELTEGGAPMARDTSRMKVHKKSRFAQIDGKHYHSLKAPGIGKPLSQWDKVRTWICLGRREDQRLHAGRPQSDWDKWIESFGNGERIFGSTLEIISQKYGEICRITGFGAFGVVLLLHKTQECNPHIDRYYAVKVFQHRPHQPLSEYKRRVSAEFLIALSLQHRNIVQAFELLPVAGNKLCECMEYCSGGDLYSLLVMSGHFEEAEADCFFKQLMRGICYMHEMGVAHRDLKPENLLLSSRGCLKISDFGNAECFRLAWENQVHMSSKHCGTGPYISPEQYCNAEFDPRPVDLWAAGIIYVVMRTGSRPWKIANDTDECFRDYLEDRRAGRRHFLIGDIGHEQNHKVLYSMLDINPLRRPAAAEILTSDWVQEVVCCEAAVPGLHD